MPICSSCLRRWQWQPAPLLPAHGVSGSLLSTRLATAGSGQAVGSGQGWAEGRGWAAGWPLGCDMASLLHWAVPRPSMPCHASPSKTTFATSLRTLGCFNLCTLDVFNGLEHSSSSAFSATPATGSARSPGSAILPLSAALFFLSPIESANNSSELTKAAI